MYFGIVNTTCEVVNIWWEETGGNLKNLSQEGDSLM